MPVAPVAIARAAHDQHHGADANCRIGKVERRPMPGLPMEIQVIDNVASKNSVDDIS